MKAKTTVLLAAGLLSAVSVASWFEDARAQQASSVGPAKQAAEKPRKQEPRIDPKADQILHQMSDYLGNLKAFTVEADHETEVVRASGQRLQFAARSKATIRRPNKFRSDRIGEVADMSFYYDGAHLTLYGARTGFYATAKAPPTIDDAVDFARERIDIEVPGADLLYANPYGILMEDAVSGTYVGRAYIGDAPVHHLAYQGNETDWQIWVEDDATPLPRKYLIVSKNMRSQPEFSVELHNWNVNAKPSDDVFEFKAPPGAKQIEFLGLRSEAKQKSEKK